MTRKVLWLAFAALVVQCVGVAHCCAQDENELTRFFEIWNAHRVREKAPLDKVFTQNLESLSVGKPKGWFEKRLAMWKQLPDILQPQLPVTTEGQAFMMSLFLENQKEFYSVLKEPAERALLVDAKAYLVLLTAQRFAQELKEDSIKPSHLFVAVANAWTGLWPICPRRSVSIEPQLNE